MIMAPARLKGAMLLHSVQVWTPEWALALGKKDANRVSGSQGVGLGQQGGLALGRRTVTI